MVRTNVAARVQVYTHEGGKAKRIRPMQELERSVLSCLLWEKTFYEDGESIADRIWKLTRGVSQKQPQRVNDLAIKARNQYNLRHCPLWMCCALANVGNLRSETVEQVVQRADELTELLSLYWKDGKKPVAASLKKGLAAAFTKFDAYQLSKYNRDNPVKLRDVLFLVHPKPKDDTQQKVWDQLVDGTLAAPDTWEVGLSTGKDKKATWERLLKEHRLGYMALLRNLRNMDSVGVDHNVIADALERGAGKARVLPFRFVAAAKAVPQWEPELETGMLKILENGEKLSGNTLFLVDVSGSMDDSLSSRSDLNRIDAASALAILLREVCQQVHIFTFSEKIVHIPPRRGFALRDAIHSSQAHSGTYLRGAMDALKVHGLAYDRMIIITDEQSHDGIGSRNQGTKGYLINVASYQNGVGYGEWIHIDGFSEQIVRFIIELETNG